MPAACAAQLGLGKSFLRMGWFLSGGTAGLLAAVYVVANLLVDLAYIVIDPRLRAA